MKKNINNNYNRYNKSSMNNNLSKSNQNFNTNSFNKSGINNTNNKLGNSLSNLSNSIETKFSTINNIRDSKIVKIKTITKKNTKPFQNIKPNITMPKKEKEKKISDDDSSDYANPDEDDFDSILRESISIKNFNESKLEGNPFNTIDNKKIKKSGNNIINNNDIKNLEKKTYNNINKYFNEDFDFNNKFPNEEINEDKIKDNKDKAFDDLISKNPYQDTNKSIEIKNLINPEKNKDISNQNILNNLPNEECNEYNLLENNNIFNNNNNNILYMPPPEKQKNKNIESNNEINFEENPELKTRLINHNIFIDKKLKEMKFLERLKSISDERYLFFIKNYRKDNNFIDKNNFENILISENNLQTRSPLTLIFQKIFNPSKNFLEKNFFEKNFTSGVNMNYLSDYDQYELKNVPKFFNDLSYVNNLFNTFNFDELNNFLEEIKTWKNTFSYEQEYNHLLIKNFKQDKYITLRNNLTIYFISPYDLIIDIHSKSSGIAFSDTLMAINQFIFHCNIDFNSEKGKFEFNTSVKILNTIKMLKNTAIINTIKEEGKKENDELIINNVWIPMKKEILEQDLINAKNMEKIYNNYLQNNLGKFNEGLNNFQKKENDSEDDWDSFSDKNNEKILDEINDVNNNILNVDMNDFNLNERNVKILKSGGIFFIGLYLIKIYFSSFSIDTIFGIFWICLIGYLIYKFR